MTAHEDRTLELAGEPASNSDSLLMAKDVARILNVPLKRVYELGIPAVRISSRSIRWRLSDVQRWIEGRIRA
jgi:predicted DNA-binding transcriptional regulator AlpA